MHKKKRAQLEHHLPPEKPRPKFLKAGSWYWEERLKPSHGKNKKEQRSARLKRQPMTFWETPDHLKMVEETFPLIEDFEVVLVNAGSLGYHAAFFSEEYGRLASIFYWDHIEQDICRSTFSIPLSFHDRDQGWEMAIEKQEDTIYILEGNGEDLGIYDIGFRVRKSRYLEQWLLEACRRFFSP